MSSDEKPVYVATLEKLYAMARDRPEEFAAMIDAQSRTDMKKKSVKACVMNGQEWEKWEWGIGGLDSPFINEKGMNEAFAAVAQVVFDECFGDEATLDFTAHWNGEVCCWFLQDDVFVEADLEAVLTDLVEEAAPDMLTDHEDIPAALAKMRAIQALVNRAVVILEQAEEKVKADDKGA